MTGRRINRNSKRNIFCFDNFSLSLVVLAVALAEWESGHRHTRRRLNIVDSASRHKALWLRHREKLYWMIEKKSPRVFVTWETWCSLDPRETWRHATKQRQPGADSAVGHPDLPHPPCGAPLAPPFWLWLYHQCKKICSNGFQHWFSFRSPVLLPIFNLIPGIFSNFFYPFFYPVKEHLIGFLPHYQSQSLSGGGDRSEREKSPLGTPPRGGRACRPAPPFTDSWIRPWQQLRSTSAINLKAFSNSFFYRIWKTWRYFLSLYTHSRGRRPQNFFDRARVMPRNKSGLELAKYRRAKRAEKNLEISF